MKLKLSAIVALALTSSVSLGAAETLTTSTINVYSATPLPSIGLPLNIVPANIQIATPKAINNQAGVTLADYMTNNLQSVSVSEMGGNPWQPEINFRGYSASPLLGMPQGLSTYVDGVRVNEPFGDVTLWDKIPNFAIGGMQLVPGSNPMYGLNTLGGAIAIQTKSGRQAQGVGIEAEYGSWNRQRALVEYGGVSKDGSMDFYIGHQTTKEDGWRQFSPSHLNQTFAKTGWQSESTKLDLSYIGTDNKLIGNGFTPDHLLTGARDQIHTRPDFTNNYYHHLALNGSHWFNKDVMLSGNTYFRKSNRHTRNGDLYETDIDDGETHDTYSQLGTCNNSGDDCELVGATMNRTKTNQENYGITGQLTFNQDWLGRKNQFIAGAGFDYSKIKFSQNEHVNLYRNWFDGINEAPFSNILSGETYTGSASVFDSSREPVLTGALPQTQTVGLTGKQWTASLFATDTLSLNEKWHLNAGARYNHTKVDNDDTLRGPYSPTNTRSLTAVDDYKRLNPSIGITHTPTDNLSIFGSYSESSRAPTSIELGCSNPENPCLLPSAMADDPPLKQVVAKTYDFGARGNLTENVKWNASIYHAMNHNDIQFIRAPNSSSRGYYSNVGSTERQGLDLGLSGQADKFKWNTSYSYLRATFDDELTLLSNPNSTAPGSSSAFRNQIFVKPGNRLPGLPEHQLKLRAQYQATPDWSIGANLTAFSSQYVMGNENNQHVANSSGCLEDGSLRDNGAACGAGKIKGYTVVNLDSQYKIGSGWTAFAKVINVFDENYNVAGRLAETMFDASGAYGAEIKSLGLIPGAPRAGWIGVRYEFGGAPEAK